MSTIPIDIGPRSNGKSSRTIAWLAEDLDHRVIAVTDATRALQMVRQARDLGYEGITTKHFVVGLNVARSLNGMRRDVKIDQADHFLQMLAGQAHIAGVTWTSEETA